MEPRKGAQGHMGREKTKEEDDVFSLPIILCSSTSRAAMCYIKTTGDESATALYFLLFTLPDDAVDRRKLGVKQITIQK